MRKIVLLILCVYASCMAVWAQSEDVFTWRNGLVVPSINSEYIKGEEITASDEDPIYVWGSERVSSPNGKYMYDIQRIDVKEMNVDSPIESFGRRMNEGVRIMYDGRPILTRWGYGPFWTVEHLTRQENEQRTFLQVPLDEGSFALIFAAYFFDYDVDAGNMLIIVVNKDKATVVYDAPAFAYKYVPAPAFALEYTETVKLTINSSGNTDSCAADLSGTTWKHKIWKEGNILKHKKWK